MAQPMVEVVELRRTFGRGRVTAVDGLSFSIGAGEKVAVLGSNGAGKTTLIKILATLLTADSGTALVAGADVRSAARAVRSRISVVLGGDRGLYGRLSALDNVRFFGVLKGMSRRDIAARAAEVLDEFGLADRAGSRVETFSRGMKQRLHLAVGMLVTPQVLMLDEPTIGLDVLEARRVRHAVTEIAANGTTVLLTSHNVADIEDIAGRVLVLKRGQLEQDVPIAQFRSAAGPVAYVRVRVDGALPDEDDMACVLGMPSGALTVVPSGIDCWTVEIPVVTWSSALLARLAQILDRAVIRDFVLVPVGLENAVGQALIDRQLADAAS